MSNVTIKLQGKRYQIKCPEHQMVELQQAAAHLDTKMAELRDNTQVFDSERLAVLTAINLCHELLNERQQVSNTIDTVNGRIKDLTLRIDQVLKQD